MPLILRYPAVRTRVAWLGEDGPDPSPEKPLTRGQKQYRRMRERMAIDPGYRERVLKDSRARSRRHRERNAEQLRERRRPRDRERYTKNRDAINVKRRANYVGQNAANIRGRNRSWYALNREQRKVYRRAYRQANGERIRASERVKSRARYAQNPRAFLDYYAAWRKANLEKARAYVRVSNLKRRAAIGSFTFDEWLELLARYDGKCGYCGSSDHIEADHRTPLSRGGSNTVDNIIPACRRCNRGKRTKTEAEFRAWLARARLRAASSELEEGPGGSALAG